MKNAHLTAREAEANAARERFMATLHELQRRLSPRSIASGVKEKADDAINAAKDGVAQAATKPTTVAAVTVPVLFYIFRKPIGRALGKLFRRKPKEEADIQPYAAAHAPVPLSTEPIRAPAKAAAEQGA
jgi:ElaB/YqjD/DUF883 family membrane-anchored ribosome-binding protein